MVSHAKMVVYTVGLAVCKQGGKDSQTDILFLCQIYAAHTYWNPKLRDSGPRLDAEAMGRDSFRTYYGTAHAKIDAEIRN